MQHIINAQKQAAARLAMPGKYMYFIFPFALVAREATTVELCGATVQ
jgi:hypothetical protein